MARCPEPKPITIALLAAAAGISWLVPTFTEKHLSLQGLATAPPALFLIYGFSLGLAAGLALALSKRLWIRVVASGLFAIAAGYGTGEIYFHVLFRPSDYAYQDIQMLRSLTIFEPLGSGIAISSIVLHHLFIRAEGTSRSTLLIVAAYIAVGAISHALFFPIGAPVRPVVLGAIVGCVFGILQFLAMLLCKAIDRRMQV
jgi:hypothetical protein